MPRKAAASLAITHPHLIDEWHPTLNGARTPKDVSKGSHDLVWWKCDKGQDHEWQAVVFARARASGVGCPICRGIEVVQSNCLSTVFPLLAKEWHPTRNSRQPNEVYARSTVKYWWQCPAAVDHVWPARIVARVPDARPKPTGCPFCEPGSYKRVALSNCLVSTHPNLKDE
jgi:hypothetical protein